jgi:hypothetical protein
VVAVERRFPRSRHAGIADAVIARASAEPEITARPRRTLLRALRHGRLVVAFDGAELVGWFLSEPCGPGVHELGFIFVAPAARGDAVLLDLLDAAVAIEPRAVAVTFNPSFARWLIRSRGFRRVSLAGVTRVSRGWFLARRLAPGRLSTALRRTTAAEAWYLVCDA